MGASKSKTRTPDATIDGSARRRQVAAEFTRLDKEERRRQRAALQMSGLPAPAPPFVPARRAPAESDAGPRLLQIDYDAEAKRRMQDQLAWDSQTFVLNQLLLSVQFFENYEREMWLAVERNRHHECLQSRRIERHCKVALLPDRLQEAIDRSVRFRPRHGVHKNTERPLHTPTMYVVHENIEVTNAGERSNYSILTSAPIYKMEIDTSAPKIGRPHVGYIRLRCVEGIHVNRMESTAVAASMQLDETTEAVADRSSSEDGEVGADEDDDDSSEPVRFRAYTKHRDSMMMCSAALRRRQRDQRSASLTSSRRGSSGQLQTQSSSSSSADNDYIYQTLMNVRRPLSAAQRISINSAEDAAAGGDTISSTQLPSGCFTHISEGSSDEDDDTDEDDDSDSEADRPPRQIHQYLNSKNFLQHFVTVFRDRLSTDLGISAASLNTATWKGCCISAQPWDIVPALSCPWPNEAFEWMHRRRDIKQNPVTQQRFQWPTPDMVSKVVSFGCLAVPMGYAPRFGSPTTETAAAASSGSGRAELEWKLVFPNAERYLEGCLTQAQCKVYVLTRALLQTFVDPFVENGGLTAEHLRAHLFWQCEHNYAAWPEEYLGEALVRFLNALLEHIKRQRLPDYFLPRRNLFENVPERVMVDLHKRIFRITENPLMFAMIALKNLKWTEAGAEGLQLDLKTLYGMVTVANPLQMVNPQFREPEPAAEGGDVDELDVDENENATVRLGGIGNQQRMAKSGKAVKKVKRTKKVRFALAEKEAEESQRRASQESINVKFPVAKHMEQLRRVLLYELFITHYLQMARSATTAQTRTSHNQALIYLKQASRLCQLLADDDRGEQAASYADVVATLQQVVLNEQKRAAEAKPQLPQRESFAQRRTGEEEEQKIEAVARTKVSRVRNLLVPGGGTTVDYTNVVSLNRAAQAECKPANRGIIRVQCDVHVSAKLGDSEDDEVRKAQTPIGANSFSADEDDEAFRAPAKEASPVVLVLNGSGNFELKAKVDARRAKLDSVDSDGGGVTAL